MDCRHLWSGGVHALAFLSTACVLSVATMHSAAAQTSSASAVDIESTPRIQVFGTLGFGGELDGEFTLEFDGDEDTEDIDDQDMEVSNGLGAGFDYPLHEYFLIGGRLAFIWANGDDFEDEGVERSFFTNIDVVPKGRYGFDGIPLEVYGAVPVGITINFPDDDFEDEFPGDLDAGNGVSWNISIVGGVNYFFSNRIGIFGEIGWYHQAVTIPGEGEFLGQDFEFVFNGAFNQFALTAGVNIGL